MNFCRNCGHKLNQGAKFCPSCGKNLEKPESEIKFDSTENTQYTPPAVNYPSSNQGQNYPNQQSPYTPFKKEKKSRKGLIIGVVAAGPVFLVLILVAYFLFFSDSGNMKTEYKKPDKDKIINTSKWGMTPVNQVVIVLKDDFGKSDAEDIAGDIKGKIVGRMDYINLFQIESDINSESDLYETIEKLKSRNEVEYAFPNAPVYCSGFENSGCNPLDDDFYAGKDGAAFEMIGLKDAWDIIKASGIKLNKVQVGVNDQPLGTKSEELGGSNIKGNGDDDIDTLSSTHHSNGVVNIIGADPDNGGSTGVASILGKDMSINVINTLNSPGDYTKEVREDSTDATQYKSSNGKSYTVKTLIDLQKQIKSGSKVINCSFNFKPPSAANSEMAGAMKKFLERMNKDHPDVIFVASAGNEGAGVDGSNDFFGQKLPNLVTVGATDEDGKPTTYSNYSTGNGEVTISACGNTKLDLNWNAEGTSFAAPQVTGVIALIKSINPDLSAEQIKKILVETAKKKTNDNELPSKYGSGMLRADDAVLKAIELKLGKKLDKKKLLELANVDLKSDGASPEFTITATVTSVSEKGTVLELECSGGEYAVGDRRKEISSPGTVTWKLTIPDPETVLSVKVTRLDTKACKTILVGGKIEAKDLVGTWTGGTCWDAWSTPYKIAEPGIKANLKLAKGEFKTMTMNMTLISDNSLQSVMDAGGYSNPLITFSFNDGNLEGTGSDGYNKYHFSGTVKSEGGMYQITGEWNSTNQAMKMNGRWKASKKVGS